MKSRKTVMVFGTFDILHRGHFNFFQQAKKYGNKLVVVVARDSNVKKSKNRTPLFDEKKRVRALEKIKLVDLAILGGKDDTLKIIEKKKPHVILLGYDQKIKAAELKNELRKRKLNVKIYRARAFMPRVYKSSKLVKLRQIVK